MKEIITYKVYLEDCVSKKIMDTGVCFKDPLNANNYVAIKNREPYNLNDRYFYELETLKIYESLKEIVATKKQDDELTY